ncbi:MFS-type transporter involved in bile tolerance (Atg22 family) [Nocardiopsis sp. Huas11]|uniref:MFS transporter n=1 Tax=Nocardiopsis sp. Huas11 TaxID=2183912 RepID=UPI000EB3E62B|nr:MFS transporter [Nocardiopsis sp. Huas11]RKS10433.1 MFS-type transporter involved in bile tolerance (Atg22 family) [Nocardiopsis sp. Huas11]
MGERRSLGRPFGWLWASYSASAMGTGLAFGAFPLIAILALDAGPAQVSVLAAVGPAVGALVAVPLGPWVEFRRKRPVMIAMGLVRCAALASLPVAFALGVLGFAHLLAVSVVLAAADIAFRAASGACLKEIVPSGGLVAASARLEATTWTATVLGPPLGTAAIGVFGPVVTVVADAVGHLLSAVGIRAMGGRERRPERAAPPGERGGAGGARPGIGDLFDGWRFLLAQPSLRRLFCNALAVNALVMSTAPLLTVLMLGDLGFAPWQYGLAFGVPCAGGLIGAWAAPRLVTRWDRRTVLLAAGTARACWLVGLAAVGPGTAGLVLVIAVEFAMITCMGAFNPVLAAVRLELTPADRVARVLTAWSVTGRAVTAAVTALWGLLAAVTDPRTALAAAGVLLLATPLLLPRTLEGSSGSRG